MKKYYFFVLSFIISFSYGQDLILSGVIDGPLTGGTPKAIEIYVVNNISDLSTYGIGSANNGGGTDGIELTFSGSATAGDYIYIASEMTQFQAFFGFDPDYESSAASINGNDAIELFENVVDNGGALTGDVIDVFGDINVDGSGESWDYTDGWAYRISDTGPDGSSFTSGNWTFSGANALDGETSNSSAASPFPNNSFNTSTAAVKEEGIPGFTIYPNPVTDGILKINTLQNASKNIQIFDLLGKLVIARTIETKTLSISNLTAGIYILKVSEEGKTATRKLVIQ